jgi:hypothetical protein
MSERKRERVGERRGRSVCVVLGEMKKMCCVVNATVFSTVLREERMIVVSNCDFAMSS